MYQSSQNVNINSHLWLARSKLWQQRKQTKVLKLLHTHTHIHTHTHLRIDSWKIATFRKLSWNDSDCCLWSVKQTNGLNQNHMWLMILVRLWAVRITLSTMLTYYQRHCSNWWNNPHYQVCLLWSSHTHSQWLCLFPSSVNVGIWLQYNNAGKLTWQFIMTQGEASQMLQVHWREKKSHISSSITMHWICLTVPFTFKTLSYHVTFGSPIYIIIIYDS